MVNLTMPLSAWLGWTETPGDVPGYGPVDADDSRALAGQLARPGNRWCVTLTDPSGHPVAHACARHGPGGKASRGGPGDKAGPATLVHGPGGEPATPVPDWLRGGPATPVPDWLRGGPATPVPDWLRGLTFTTLQTTGCTHPRESRGYQPSRGLRHLIGYATRRAPDPAAAAPPLAATSTTSPPTTVAAGPANATSTPPASHNHTRSVVVRSANEDCLYFRYVARRISFAPPKIEFPAGPRGAEAAG